MKLIMGFSGSGKTSKVAELATNYAWAGENVKIFIKEDSSSRYFIKNIQPQLGENEDYIIGNIDIHRINNLEDILLQLIKYTKNKEYDSIFIDIPFKRSAVNYRIIEILNDVLVRLEISGYITMHSRKRDKETNRQKGIEIIEFSGFEY